MQTANQFPVTEDRGKSSEKRGTDVPFREQFYFMMKEGVDKRDLRDGNYLDFSNTFSS